LVVEAPAKVNLFLEILAKRNDGFHELETLMVSVDLYDTLVFMEGQSERVTLRCVDAGSQEGTDFAGEKSFPGGRDNLVVQAARLLREYTGVKNGVRIDLVKRIPVAAGLAGGSSDAAATLMALSRLWNLRLSAVELEQLALQLGSDVGFFLSPSVAAICRGRGEKIEPLCLSDQLHFVIARPPTGLSTAVVFRNCSIPDTPRQVEPLAAALRQGNLGRAVSHLHNGLQLPAEKLNPDVQRLRSIFSQQPVLGHLMSGSGTSYFGLCANRRQAIQVAARLRLQHVGRVFVAQSRS
jgi:4-diphosphocytidyl-2-C-methyl-D-erythritol kinase